MPLNEGRGPSSPRLRSIGARQAHGLAIGAQGSHPSSMVFRKFSVAGAVDCGRGQWRPEDR